MIPTLAAGTQAGRNSESRESLRAGLTPRQSHESVTRRSRPGLTPSARVFAIPWRRRAATALAGGPGGSHGCCPGHCRRTVVLAPRLPGRRPGPGRCRRRRVTDVTRTPPSHPAGDESVAYCDSDSAPAAWPSTLTLSLILRASSGSAGLGHGHWPRHRGTVALRLTESGWPLRARRRRRA